MSWKSRTRIVAAIAALGPLLPALLHAAPVAAEPAEPPAPAAPAAQAAPSPAEGLWQGSLIYKPAELEADVYVELARDANGKWVGTLDLLNQRLQFQPLDNVRVDGSSVAFDYNRFAKKAQVMVETPFTGTLSADGMTLKGDFFEGKQNHIPLQLKKIGGPGSDRPKARRAAVHPLSDHGEELRAQFNRDAGKTRLVMLLSPT